MNQIDKLVKKNHDYWLGNKTTYLASPEYDEKAKKALIGLAEKYFPEKKAKAIDVVCGNGDNTSLLSTYFHSIDGYELSEGRVEYARAHNPLPNGFYKSMDIENELPKAHPASLDAIFLLGVTSSIHSDEALGKLFSHFHGLLAPDGYLITRDSLSHGYTYRKSYPSGYFGIYRSNTAFLRLFANAGFILADSQELVNNDALINSMYVFKKGNRD